MQMQMHYIVVLPNDATNLTIFFFVFLFFSLLFFIHLCVTSISRSLINLRDHHTPAITISLFEQIGKRSNGFEIRSCGNQTSIRAANTQSSNRESSMTFGIFFPFILLVSYSCRFFSPVFALVYFPC